MPVLTKDVVIAINESLSTVAEIGGSALVGMITPAAWTTAGITLQGSHNSSAFNNMYDSAGSEKTISAAASRYIMLDPADFAGCDAIKIRSGTSGAAVNQAAARTVTLVLMTL